jgi:hypothetical protein
MADADPSAHVCFRLLHRLLVRHQHMLNATVIPAQHPLLLLLKHKLLTTIKLRRSKLGKHDIQLMNDTITGATLSRTYGWVHHRLECNVIHCVDTHTHPTAVCLTGLHACLVKPGLCVLEHHACRFGEAWLVRVGVSTMHVHAFPVRPHVTF